MEPPTDRPAPPATLMALTGPLKGRVQLLDGHGLVIGRAPDVDVTIDRQEVSRRHVRVMWDGASYAVEDLGSKNGTLLNGKPLATATRLVAGDEIAVPGALFRFQPTDVTATAVSQPPATGALRIDPARGEVFVRDVKLALTAKEFKALAYLASKDGALVAKDDLANAVWPENNGITSDESIEQLISRLRHKIEDDPGHPARLVTRRGLGYQLQLD